MLIEAAAVAVHVPVWLERDSWSNWQAVQAVGFLRFFLSLQVFRFHPDLLLLRRAMLSETPRPADVGLAFKSLLRKKPFHVVLPVVIMCFTVWSFILFHMEPYLIEEGYAEAVWQTIILMTGVCSKHPDDCCLPPPPASHADSRWVRHSYIGGVWELRPGDANGQVGRR
jgi:hypothetical protein